MNQEYWKPVPAYEQVYAVSNLGRVRRISPGASTRSGRILKPHEKRGYLTVVLTLRGKCKMHRIHRLVAAAFIGPPPPETEVNHKNGDKADNRPENLEYVTHRRNMEHASVALGVLGRAKGDRNWTRRYPEQVLRGEAHGSCKYSDEVMQQVRQALAQGGITHKQIAQRFGISKAQVSRFAHNRRS